MHSFQALVLFRRAKYSLNKYEKFHYFMFVRISIRNSQWWHLIAIFHCLTLCLVRKPKVSLKLNICIYIFFSIISEEHSCGVGIFNFFLFCPFNACSDFYLSLYISISRKHESTLWARFPYPRQVYKETGSKAFR